MVQSILAFKVNEDDVMLQLRQQYSIMTCRCTDLSIDGSFAGLSRLIHMAALCSALSNHGADSAWTLYPLVVLLAVENCLAFHH